MEDLMKNRNGPYKISLASDNCNEPQKISLAVQVETAEEAQGNIRVGHSKIRSQLCNPTRGGHKGQGVPLLGSNESVEHTDILARKGASTCQ